MDRVLHRLGRARLTFISIYDLFPIGLLGLTMTQLSLQLAWFGSVVFFSKFIHFFFSPVTLRLMKRPTAEHGGVIIHLYFIVRYNSTQLKKLLFLSNPFIDMYVSNFKKILKLWQI